MVTATPNTPPSDTLYHQSQRADKRESMAERQAAENDVFLQQLMKKIENKHQPESLKSDELERVKQEWYVAKLVYQAAQDISIDSYTGLLCDLTAPQGCKDLRERLLSAECKEIISAATPVSSKSGLLGIPLQTAPNKHTLTGVPDSLVQKKLHQKLVDISQFHQPSVPGAGTNLLNAKALQLHHVVSKDRSVVSANEREIELLHLQKLSLIRKLQKVYSRNLELLESLLAEHSLKCVPETSSLVASSLKAKTEALAAKVGLIEKELLGDTYTLQLVKQLTVIRNKIDTEMMTARNNLNVAEKEYASCLSAGTEFQRIAKEYSDLKTDIKSRVWALDELKAAKQHKY